MTAVAAMFVGMKQASLLLPQPWSTHVLIGYVAWLASLRILLLVHKHVCVNRCESAGTEVVVLLVCSDGTLE